MQTNLCKTLLALVLIAVMAVGGCTSMKRWVGLEKGEEDEDMSPPEAKEDQVIIDGKTYVRSKNPYWLNTPGAPEYMYVEKGREFVGLQQNIVNAIAKAIGKQQEKAMKGAVPPDKVQELVRQEVERILRDQGLAGFVSRGQAGRSSYSGRAVAVIPDLDTPRNFEGQNRTLAVAVADALRKQKDVSVAGDEQVRAALGKAGVAGKLRVAANVKALGDFLGVQAIILTGIMPPEKGAAGVLALEIYDAFLGTKTAPVVAPAENLNPPTINKFAQDNALRVAAELAGIEWFGRVEFVKEGKVYLSLGQNAGLKVGDRLKVVAPGKEVLNPRTQAVLGYTADTPQGELKVTELLGTTGAVAQSMSGGPFKSGDKVRAR